MLVLETYTSNIIIVTVLYYKHCLNISYPYERVFIEYYNC